MSDAEQYTSAESDLIKMSKSELLAEVLRLRAKPRYPAYRLIKSEDSVTALSGRPEDIMRELGVYRQILDVLPDDVYLFFKDDRFHFTHVNEAARKSLGKAYEEIVGTEDKDLIPDPRQAAQYREWDKNVIALGEPHNVEESWDDANGVHHLLTTTRYPLIDVDTKRPFGVLSVTKDATPRYKEHAKIYLVEQVFRTFRHDAINSLALNINARIQAVAERGRPMDAGELSGLRHATALLFALIENVSYYILFQLQHDIGQEYRLKGKNQRWINARELVDSVSCGTDFIANEPICLNLVPQELNVFVDETLCKALIFNLIMNAKKFGPPDQKPIEICGERTSDGFIKLQVRNEGPEPDADVIRHFSKPNFGFTAPPPPDRDGTRREPSGTGIGLTFCASIAAAHGGPREILYERITPPETGGYGWNLCGVLLAEAAVPEGGKKSDGDGSHS